MTPSFAFDNSYARELEGFYVRTSAANVPEPTLLRLNDELAGALWLDPEALCSAAGVAVLAGNEVPSGAEPLAQAYAGHQFGGFVPQLGDGRALLLGEVVDRDGIRRDIQLKGSGPTHFSRGGDGKAALGPVLREYLFSEAMHALGIPTTRALAAVATGEQVRREGLLPGAVLTRVAASHLRIGTFQFFAARQQTAEVLRLVDYSLARHYPELGGAERGLGVSERARSEKRGLALLTAVVEAQARLVARWMHVGFVHGVMNTDNMTISGETIDYGPCAFLDAHDPNAVFSSIDRGGRYAYGNQPLIAQWNLARLAETLLPAIHEEPKEAASQAETVVRSFDDRYREHWSIGMRTKLGLARAEATDVELAEAFLRLLAESAVDHTLAFRRLSHAVRGDRDPVRSLFADPAPFDAWSRAWQERLEREEVAPTERAENMDRVNPVYIPRNHKVEEALAAAADGGDLGPFDDLQERLERPFDEREDSAEYAQPAPPEFGPHRTFCGT